MSSKRNVSRIMGDSGPIMHHQRLGDAEKICAFINSISLKKLIIVRHLAIKAEISDKSAKNILQVLAGQQIISSMQSHTQKRYYRKENRVTIQDIEDAQLYRIYK